MPTTAWQAITSVGVNAPIAITVRSAQVQNGALSGGPWTGSSGTIEIAPVPASGTVVYWTTGGDPAVPAPALKGFQMGFPLGEATPQPVLTPATVGGGSQCVACHTSSPDGLFAGLTTSTAPQDGGDPASMDIRSVDGKATRPPFLTPSAIALLGRTNQQSSSFSRAHWTPGDRVMLSMLGMNGTQIAWTDLEATGQVQGTDWGVIARNGDANDAAVAQFSHDGQTIVYTSAPGGVGSGSIGPAGGHVYSVPYNNRMGGNATPVPGASDPAYSQCYASYSADDKYLVFNRDPPGTTTYNNNQSEIFITPFDANMPVRLAANDPPACLGVTSPGITNSWGKWSPQALSNCGNTYYFLVFSSTRDPQANGGQQLYVAPIVVDGTGKVTTYSALYLWNQPEQEHNHTPAWDVFQIPVQCVGNGGGCTSNSDCCNSPKVSCVEGMCEAPVQ
jgi:hypothetical protein